MSTDNTHSGPGPTLAPAAGSAASGLLDRIRDYLLSGGSFNPELADHYAVRDLIIDCRDWIAGMTVPPNSGLTDK